MVTGNCCYCYTKDGFISAWFESLKWMLLVLPNEYFSFTFLLHLDFLCCLTNHCKNVLLSYSTVIIIIIKLRWALFVTYTIVQSITSSEMCSLHLTHPCAHTPGAVGSRHCGARGAVGGSVPCSRVSPQSWTIPAGAKIRTHNLGLQVRHSIH